MEEAYENSTNKKWIQRFVKEESVKFEDYDRNNFFHQVCKVSADTSIKTKTVIKFLPIIDKKEYYKKQEWIYLIVIDSYIVKIGGTRVGLKNRFGSYIAGHHTVERGKSGDCSKTNAVIYNTIDFYLNFDCEVKIYGYKVPQTSAIIDVLGEKIEIVPQTYHVYESKFLEDFKKKYKNYPVLSKNCDPNYKEES